MRWMLLLTLAACDGSTDPTDTDADTDTAAQSACPADATCVTMKTSLGDMVIQMAVDEAPITTTNFLSYTDSGFFDGTDGGGATIFHRVKSGFMIQGGGFTAAGARKATQSPIAIESDNGLKNVRGTIAMARTTDPNSATSQFFINHVDNDFLNYTGAGNPGYAVFGEVIEGLDTLDAIAATPVDDPNSGSPKPLTDVIITSCARTE